MKPQLRLKLFGTPQFIYQDVSITGFRTNKARALLIYLAVTGRPHSRDALAHLLWADKPATSRVNLKKALSNLRKLDGISLIEEGWHLVALDLDSRGSDVAEFEKLSDGITTADPATLQSAIQLYQDDFLAGFNTSLSHEFEEWVLGVQTRLRGQMVAMLRQLADVQVQRNEVPRVIAALRRLLQFEPWQEEVHRQLIELLALSGDRAAALAQYDQCYNVLADELDVEPSPATVALISEIRAGEFDHSANKLPVANISSVPVIGSFKTDLLEMPDMGSFCGREDELIQLHQRVVVDSCRLCVILGVGGVGKTSLAATFITSLAGCRRDRL